MSKKQKKIEPEVTPVKLVKKVTESQFMKEFKEFINRGNVVELAIGVAVGGAFTTIVKSLVDDIIMPITSLLAGGADFRRWRLMCRIFLGRIRRRILHMEIFCRM